MEPEYLLAVAAVILGPYGATRVAMNGTRETVRRIEAKVDALAETVGEDRVRLSVLEARVSASHKA